MRKRNLSEFMCIEMLYDYKSEKLDALRTQAVEEGLQSSPKVREELQKLSFGMDYCEKLQAISISEELMDLISNQPKATEKLFSKIKWHQFPQPVRWALEAVVVAVAIALFVIQVPDLFKGEKVESDSMLVKKFDIKPPEELAINVDTQVIKEAYKAPEAVPMDLGQPKDAAIQIKAKVEAPVAKPLEVKTPTPATTEAQSTPKKGNAYVYRMTMYVDNVDQVTPEIVALISSLGGEKAGEVELGWRRKGGSYFHFSVPQINSLPLQEGLKKYAPFNIVKSAHPRVMPEDTERYILWLEKKATAEVEQPADGTQDTQSPSDPAAPAEENTQKTSEESNEAN